MDETVVRARAEDLCVALVGGDIDRAITVFSPELQRNLGEVLSMLPLPAKEASVESVEHSGPGYNVVLRLVGDTEEALIQTRWKERDGHLMMIESSHLSAAPVVGTEDSDDATEEPT